MNSIWIARDEDGSLYAYKTRPMRSQEIWIDMAHYERGGTSKKLVSRPHLARRPDRVSNQRKEGLTMGGIEYGKCEICGKEAPLERTYFYYPIHCECCGSKDKDGQKQHFVMVCHCKDCPAPMPKVIHPMCRAADGKSYKAHITNMLPTAISGQFIIDEPIIKEGLTMERKIGEIFKHKGEWYQCVADTYATNCTNCHINDINLCNIYVTGYCTEEYRKDGNNVCFKKLEKVGEPYSSYCPPTGSTILFQRYRTYETPIFKEKDIYYTTGGLLFIDIEIKQNQEDMKEKKLNLKPFDLEAARSGKPVCTRDGRKARIICFDRDSKQTPIVALVDYHDKSDGEAVRTYTDKGFFCVGEVHSNDLMMLPEKHEGWVNIYKYSTPVYESEEKAMSCIGSEKRNEYVATVKISWEE